MKEEFFKQYPNAKPLWRVGNKTYLHHAKVKAELEAAMTGQSVEILQAAVKTVPKYKAAKTIEDGTE